MNGSESESLNHVTNALIGLDYLPCDNTGLVSFLAVQLVNSLVAQWPNCMGKIELPNAMSRKLKWSLLRPTITRELTESLTRRCCYLSLDYADSEYELEIVRLHSPELEEHVARKLVEIIHRVRELALKKPPSIAESIDWARTLMLLGAT